jgi:hypothetical protein
MTDYEIQLLIKVALKCMLKNTNAKRYSLCCLPTENNHLKLINYGRINRWINMDKFILGVLINIETICPKLKRKEPQI